MDAQPPSVDGWKSWLLTGMTLVVVIAAHWHSYVAARRDLAAMAAPGWRRIVRYILLHELHYLKQAPLMVFFVCASVVVVMTL